MPKRPNYAVEDGIEVVLRKLKERAEIEFDQCFQKTEEIGPNLRERVEVTCDERQGWCKNQFD